MVLISGLATIKVALAMSYVENRGELDLFRDMGLSGSDTSITIGYLDDNHEPLTQRKGVFSNFLRMENDLCFLKLNLDAIGSDVSKLVICVDRPGSNGVGLLKEITFNCYNGSPGSGADDVFFHVADLKRISSVVLAVLSRHEDQWALGYPGAAFDFSSDQWMGDRPISVECRKRVVGILRSTLPNALSPEIFRGRFDAKSVAHFLKYSPSSLLSKIYTAGKSFQFDSVKRQDSVVEAASPAGKTLKEYATQMFLSVWHTWPDLSLDADRKDLLKGLFADGADWVQALPVESNDPEGDPIRTLHLRAYERTNWAAALLALIPEERVLAYANTREKADAVYDINPLRYLMDQISEDLRVSTLETDLGL